MIAAGQLSKYFGRTQALHAVSLDIRRGESVAVLGANGAGKTTLMRILATLDKPSAGSLAIGGLDALKARQQVRRMTGVVAHQTFLHPELTLEEELRFYGRLYGVPALNDRVHELLAWSGLESPGLRVAALSRGQQQRLALARALLHDPAILLLDEPDTGLDVDGRAKLTTLLRDTGRTIVFSSHDRAWANNVADRVVTLEAGRLRDG